MSGACFFAKIKWMFEKYTSSTILVVPYFVKKSYHGMANLKRSYGYGWLKQLNSKQKLNFQFHWKKTVILLIKKNSQLSSKL